VGSSLPTGPRLTRFMDAAGNVAETFGLYWPNLIAQVILFFIVYLVLRHFAFKPIIAMLEERRRRIEEGQLNVEKIKQQLAEAQAKYEEIVAKANAEAQRLIEEVKASGERLAEDKRQAATAEAQDIIRRTHESLALERERTLVELKKEVGRLVVETTEKVTNKILTPQDHQTINEETARQIAA
jgi:F-type H+-transporting ATPase subunit b